MTNRAEVDVATDRSRGTSWLAVLVLNYAATRSNLFGTGVAFVAELLISLGFRATVLLMSNMVRLTPHAPGGWHGRRQPLLFCER